MRIPSNNLNRIREAATEVVRQTPALEGNIEGISARVSETTGLSVQEVRAALMDQAIAANEARRGHGTSGLIDPGVRDHGVRTVNRGPLQLMIDQMAANRSTQTDRIAPMGPRGGGQKEPSAAERLSALVGMEIPADSRVSWVNLSLGETFDPSSRKLPNVQAAKDPLDISDSGAGAGDRLEFRVADKSGNALGSWMLKAEDLLP